MVDQTTKPAKLPRLVLSITTIGMVGFGGGAAVIPLFHKEIIEKYQWMTEEEFSDMLSVANALPGPIQTKLAGYIGYRLKGILGMLLGLIAIILPSLAIMLIFYNAINYYKDKNWVHGAINSVFPVVAVMMVTFTWQLFTKAQKSLKLVNNLILLIISGIVLIVFKINPAILIVIILISAFLPKMSDYGRFAFIAATSAIVILIIKLNVLGGLFGFIHLSSGSGGMNTLFQIFFAFLIPGSVGYGGGPGSIPLIYAEVVTHFNLITGDQFNFALAIQGALPGVTATKLAGTIGYQNAGFLGALIGVTAYAVPSLILMIVLLKLINKYKTSPVVKRLTSYVGPVITVLLAQLAVKFFTDSVHNIGWYQSPILVIISFLLLEKLKVHPFIVILLTMAYGAVYALI